VTGEPRRVYTKDPTVLLDPGERPMYDAMLEHSKVLKTAATVGLKELLELTAKMGELPTSSPEATELAGEIFHGMHRLLTYAFTLGSSFAFDQIAKTMGPQLQQDNILNINKRRKES
jgi:hypothetical protein